MKFKLSAPARKQRGIRALQSSGISCWRSCSLERCVGSRASFEVTGISHRLQQGLSIGYGYTAIIVAWMSQLNPLAVPFVALALAALAVGGDQVQMVMGLPAAMGVVMQGLILFPMLAGSLFTEYTLKVVRSERSAVCHDQLKE